LYELSTNSTNYEAAHKLVNKIAYLGDKELLDLCRKLDKK